MKSNHTSLIKLFITSILFLSAFEANADGRGGAIVSPTVRGGGHMTNGSLTGAVSAGANAGAVNTGSATGGVGASGGLAVDSRDATAVTAGDPDQATANDQVNGGPTGGLAAAIGAAAVDMVNPKWREPMPFYQNSTNYVPVGTYRSTPSSADEYMNSLPKAPGTISRATGRYAPPAAASCNNFSQMSFAGINFIGDATCVAAKNDTEASNACAAYGGRYINPANPQYGLNISGGTRTANPDGYYYCVSNQDTRNSKQIMCQNIARYRYPGMTFTWDPQPGNDGNCLCNITGQPARTCNDVGQIAAQTQQAQSQACQGSANVIQSQGIPAAQLQGRVPGTFSDGLYCQCSQTSPARGTYAKVPLDANSCTGSATTQAAGTTPPNAEFDRCLTEYREKARLCETQANQAKNTCEEKIKNAQNSPLNIAGGMVGALGQVGMAANANSGNQQNCFGAGVGMMGVREALRQGRETCDNEFGTCRNSCAEETYNRMLTECPSKLTDPNTRQPMTQTALEQAGQRGDENARVFESTRAELQQKFAAGRRICTQEAGGAAQDMSRLMSGLGNSIQQSMRCACNVSSGSQNANCNQIPSIQTCETNPGTPGCELYSGVDSCNPSSIGYNQQMCNCAQNPTTCTTVSGTPPPSMFGGNLANAPAPSGGNGFAGNLGAGGGGRGGYAADVGEGGEAQAALARPEFGRGGGGGAAGGLGGMGGGAGSGSGGPSGDGAPKVEAEGKGLAGLFNQAKMALGSAFGFGKGGAAGKTTASGKPGSKDDLTKFKPRNLASTGRNGIGTANMDIFGMIKMCAQGETCETNRPKSAWILTP